MKRVSVVEDDNTYAKLLQAMLKDAGYEVNTYQSSGRFVDSLSSLLPDLAVLDLQLPGVSGWDLIQMLRQKSETRYIPVIIVSGQYRTPQDVVRALELGADEYFLKPMQNDLFLCRVEALLRRASWQQGASTPPPSQILRIGQLVVNLSEREVSLAGKPLSLTPREFELLAYLMRNRNRVLSRGLILDNVWESNAVHSVRTVDKHVEALRKKLGRFGKQIKTFSKAGYSLKA